MTDKIHRLKDLVITNIDLVDKGANPDANIVLFKRDNEGGQTSVLDEIVKLLGKEGDDKMTLKEILAKLSEEEQGIIKADIETKEAVVVKSADALKAKEGELTKSNDELKVANDALAKIKKDSGEEDKNKPEDILKSATPEVKELFAKNAEQVKKAQEDAEAAKKSADEAIKKTAELETIAKKKEFIAKAATYEGLPVKSDEFGEVLMKIADKLGKEDYEKLNKTLEAADKAIVAGNLFKVEGSDNAGTSGDAVQKIAKGVEEIMKGDPKLTKEAAEVKYLEAHPEAYKDYEDEKGV